MTFLAYHSQCGDLQLRSLHINHHREPDTCGKTANTTMSFLRAQSSRRLCRSFAQAPRSSRCLTTTAPRRLGEPDPKAIPDVESMQATEDQATLVAVDHQPESTLEQYHHEHQPDYAATVDHGTSTYSPVPKRVMNGSEPGETTPAAILSGAPVDLQARTVR